MKQTIDIFEQAAKKVKSGLWGIALALVFVIEAFLSYLVDQEVDEFVGAARYERAERREAVRNGSNGAYHYYLPFLGEARVRRPHIKNKNGFKSQAMRMVKEMCADSLDQEMALLYLSGLHLSDIERFLKAIGQQPLGQSQIALRVKRVLDPVAREFKERRLDGQRPVILYLDALYETIQVNGRCRKCAVIVAMGVMQDGTRELLDLRVAANESSVSYRRFLGSLRRRGLGVPVLVVSDAHGSIKKAVRETFPGAAWQRCCEHHRRDVLKELPRRTPWAERRKAILDVRAIYDSKTRAEAERRFLEFRSKHGKARPKMVARLSEGFEDTLTFLGFPEIPAALARSGNELERLNGMIRHRTRSNRLFTSLDSYETLAICHLLDRLGEWGGRTVADPAALAAVMERRDSSLQALERLMDSPLEASRPKLLPAPVFPEPRGVQLAWRLVDPNPGGPAPKGLRPAETREAEGAPRLAFNTGPRAPAEPGDRAALLEIGRELALATDLRGWGIPPASDSKIWLDIRSALSDGSGGARDLELLEAGLAHAAGMAAEALEDPASGPSARQIMAYLERVARGEEPVRLPAREPGLPTDQSSLEAGAEWLASVNSKPLPEAPFIKVTLSRQSLRAELPGIPGSGVATTVLVGVAVGVGANGRREVLCVERSARGEWDLADRIISSLEARGAAAPGAVVFDPGWIGMREALPSDWAGRAVPDRDAVAEAVANSAPSRMKKQVQKQVARLYAPSDGAGGLAPESLTSLKLLEVERAAGDWHRRNRRLRGAARELLEMREAIAMSMSLLRFGVSQGQASSASVEAKALSDAAALPKAGRIPDAGTALLFMASRIMEKAAEWEAQKPCIDPRKIRIFHGEA